MLSELRIAAPEADPDELSTDAAPLGRNTSNEPLPSALLMSGDGQAQKSPVSEVTIDSDGRSDDRLIRRIGVGYSRTSPS
jgi:hypothetical protein